MRSKGYNKVAEDSSSDSDYSSISIDMAKSRNYNDSNKSEKIPHIEMINEETINRSTKSLNGSNRSNSDNMNQNAKKECKLETGSKSDVKLVTSSVDTLNPDSEKKPSDKARKDLICYTLQSFIGKPISEVELDEEQKRSIVQIKKMPEEKFEKVCNDLMNEILRRNGLSHDNFTEIGLKLQKISHAKFLRLVEETLTVFYNKNPEMKIEDMPEFLKSCNDLISALKEKTEGSLFLDKIENFDFFGKIYSFIEFSENKGINKNVIDKMKKIIANEIEDKSVSFLEILTFPEIFLKRAESILANDHTEKISRKIECKESYDRINTKLDDGDLIKFKKIKNEIIQAKISSRSDVIKEKMHEILMMLIKNISIPSKKIELFENEISGVIEILEEIENEVQAQKGDALNKSSPINILSVPVNLTLLFEKLTMILSSIISKSVNLSFKNREELESQLVSVKNIKVYSSRKEAFILILSAAKDIRCALTCI